MTPADRRRLEEQSHLYDELRAQLDEPGRRLLERLDRLHSDALVAETDRVLLIAGQLCAQFEEDGLFGKIYATALDGCDIHVDDDRWFLAHPDGPENHR